MNEPTTLGESHWTYGEWVEHTVRKIVGQALSVSRDDLADYLNVQVRVVIGQAHRHGQSGRSDDEPVVP